MIAADRLMEIACLVLIEGVASKVEHSVAGRLVLEYCEVCLCRFDWSGAYGVAYEHAVIEVALVHLPHVEEAYEGDDASHSHGIEFLHAIDHHNSGTHQYDEERTPAVADKGRHAYLGEVGE